MSNINWTAVIISTIFAAAICFLVHGCIGRMNNESQQDFAKEKMMIDAGFVKEQVPSSYIQVWVKKDQSK